ncbi:hypothetical protein [Haloferax larsenii]|uniref:Uncharacterized protein n=1 Tax=Haloferax larsenii TaxID=302484 RepID=A0A1H7N1C0_HALLR|nr:hypothetical protein [Haloferax larsenii]SEL17396.1 hypothetical protein SAMN04488691_103165 [Haloferax larsenii]
MIIAPAFSGGGGAGGGDAPLHETFLLYGAGIYFAPFFAPQRIRNGKERNLSRESNFCGGEDVTDLGSKNRDIHVSGLILRSEIRSFDNIVDSNDPLTLVLDGWSGEVRVAGGEWEGPVGYEPQRRERLFKYSFDFVSTGLDENSDGYEDGIISEGN